MAGKRILLDSIKSLSSIFIVTFSVGSCFFSSGGPFWGPPEGSINIFETVHVESIDIPASIHVNEAVIFRLHISANADPGLLISSITLRCRTDSAIVSQETSNDQYESGLFFGLHIIPKWIADNNLDLGFTRPEIELPVTFTESGRQVLYIGHYRNSQDGGRGINRNPDMSNEYPAESALIEYLKVEVNVLP